MGRVVTYTEFEFSEWELNRIVKKYVAEKLNLSVGEILEVKWRVRELGVYGYQGTRDWPTGYEFEGCLVRVKGERKWRELEE